MLYPATARRASHAERAPDRMMLLACGVLGRRMPVPVPLEPKGRLFSPTR
jgi:hypothetical protein